MMVETPLPQREVPGPIKKIKVGLVQLGNVFSGQCYFPLSAGMLQAYAQKHLTDAQNYKFITPLHTFLPIEKAADQLNEADLVGFSAYVWNFENSLAIAKELKKRKPEMVIVFGGPHVPDSKKQFQRIKKSDPLPDELKRKRVDLTEEFHRKYPCIDMACHGEGEHVFKIILEQMAIDGCRDKSKIPSISFLDNSGRFFHHPKLGRMFDLSQVPSPYLTGVFNPLIKAHPEQNWIAMWETNRGCPYQCTYCDWGGAIEDKISEFDLEQKKLEATWFGEHKVEYIFCADANFLILKRDIEICKYLVEAKAHYGYPQAISVQNAKNPKPHTFEGLRLLEEAGLNKATVMSIQSKNKETLKAVRRENMKTEEYQGIQKRLRAQGTYTMTDYIIPMPMETYESVLKGICEIIADGQYDRIQFNNLSILPNAEMGDPEYQEEYDMEIIQAKIINYHGKKNSSISGIEEYQQLVIATSTMPRKEWVKARSFCHLVSLIFFDKLLQIPILTAWQVYQIPLEMIFEKVTEKVRQPQEFPVFSEIFGFFEQHAQDMQNGRQEEMVHSPEWLDIWWYPDEYIFIQLCRENKLEAFYQEAEKLLMSCLGYQPITDILSEAVKLNQTLIKIPFQTSNLELTLSYNIWEFYRAILVGKNVPIIPGDYRYLIDRTTEHWDSWEEWYEKMVWYCNRRGAYLYGNKNPHQEIAGHY